MREHQERADNPSRTYLNDCEESPDMTPEEAAVAITGVKDDGGICTPNSGMGRSRQIAQAIREAILVERERCARIAERENEFLIAADIRAAFEENES